MDSIAVVDAVAVHQVQVCFHGPRRPAAHAVGVGVARRGRLLDVEVGQEVGVDVDETCLLSQPSRSSSESSKM